MRYNCRYFHTSAFASDCCLVVVNNQPSRGAVTPVFVSGASAFIQTGLNFQMGSLIKSPGADFPDGIAGGKRDFMASESCRLVTALLKEVRKPAADHKHQHSIFLNQVLYKTGLNFQVTNTVPQIRLQATFS